jgi:hypothetical protein
VREQMRRDMLSSLNDGEEDPIMKQKRELGLLDGGEKVEDGQADKGDWKGVVWQDEVSGTKKVLSMDVSVPISVVGTADFLFLRPNRTLRFYCPS